MSNYLKKSLFTLLILMVPYMNFASKAMDIEDHDGSTIRTHKVSFDSEDQQDVQSFTKHSDSSQVVSLGDSQDSWASYLLSPAKSIIRNTVEIMNFATQSPQKAMFIGAILVYQVSAVAALNCTGCYRCNCECSSVYGPANGILECTQACKLADRPFSGCWKF